MDIFYDQETKKSNDLDKFFHRFKEHENSKRKLEICFRNIIDISYLNWVISNNSYIKNFTFIGRGKLFDVYKIPSNHKSNFQIVLKIFKTTNLNQDWLISWERKIKLLEFFLHPLLVPFIKGSLKESVYLINPLLVVTSTANTLDRNCYEKWIIDDLNNKLEKQLKFKIQDKIQLGYHYQDPYLYDLSDL